MLKTTLLACAAAMAFVLPAAAATDLREAESLLNTAARESGRPAYAEASGVQFRPEDHVFVKSALAIDFTFRKATVTLPLFRGLGPSGRAVYYIVTEASDYDVAKRMGVNYAPKMQKAANSDAAQHVTIHDGVMHFRGDVDFSPVYRVVPGSPSPFPPKVFEPGAVADARWSSIVVTPAGYVLNVQMVHNASGSHDRVKAIDLKGRTVTLSVLDGIQDGKPYFFHLVTDVSAKLPSVLEKGVFAPKLAKTPTFGKSLASDDTALLGFSPVVNGPADVRSGQEQGFVASLSNNGIDPVNVFPIPPSNDDPSPDNNYSPLWDAHISMWTAKGVAEHKVRRITSIDDLKTLVADGYATSAGDNPPGPGNPYVAGLRPSDAVINCPVIAHPEHVIGR